MSSDGIARTRRAHRWSIALVTTASALLVAVAVAPAPPSGAAVGGRGRPPASSVAARPASGSTGTTAAPGRPGRGIGPAQVLTDTQDFQDVPTTSTFFPFLHNISQAGIVGGYPCGAPNEPCVGPLNLPYYRPSNAVTRAQMTKFVDLARHSPGFAISTSSDALPVSSNSDAPGGTGLYGTTATDGSVRTINTVNAGVAGYAFGPGLDGGSVGLVGYASHDNGAWIATGAVSNTYGLYVSQGGALLEAGNSSIGNTLFVDGPLVVTGPKTGYVTDIVRNTGSTDLHPGDLAAVTGASAGPEQLRGIPLPGAAATSGAYDTGVLGVVDMRWIPGDPAAPVGTAARTGAYDLKTTVIHPGEYMSVVTLGLCKGVRVDATAAPIRPGDLLTSSATPGVAMRATDKLQAVGAVIGKAMGGLDAGTGTIPVLVTLR